MRQYQWKAGARFQADAQAVGSELEALGEDITTEQVVENARQSLHSELHKCFQWDDNVAAEEYRKWQARTLLRSIEIVWTEYYEPGDAPLVPSYINIVREDGERVYRQTPAVLVNEITAQQAIEDVRARLRQLAELLRDYQHLSAVLQGLYDGVQRLVSELETAKT